MKWQKLGRIFLANGQTDWLISYSSCPFAQHIAGDIFKIWFAPRDAKNRSYTAWIEIDITQPHQVLRHSVNPVLAPGGLGSFDEDGAMFSWLLEHEGQQYIYYTGWNIGGTVPFRNAIGMAIANSKPAETFERVSLGPVLDRNADNPYFVGNPCVLVIDGHWHLWFISGTAWHLAESPKPAWSSYHIRHADSSDGVHWTVDGEVSIDFQHSNEMAIARPCVRYLNPGFEMWYCYRGTDFTYRLGYATSVNGKKWQRMDHLVDDLTTSASGWDAEMVAYPHVFEHQGKTYLLYCGGGFSKTGIGLAILNE